MHIILSWEWSGPETSAQLPQNPSEGKLLLFFNADIFNVFYDIHYFKAVDNGHPLKLAISDALLIEV
jgi:hypothetical protein